MPFKPLHDRVLVKRIESDEKTAGGLIIPDNAKEKPAEGLIVSVGAGAKDDDTDRIEMDVKAGDKILFGKWSGTEVQIDGEELLIMKESDILGVIAGTGQEAAAINTAHIGEGERLVSTVEIQRRFDETERVAQIESLATKQAVQERSDLPADIIRQSVQASFDEEDDKVELHSQTVRVEEDQQFQEAMIRAEIAGLSNYIDEVNQELEEFLERVPN